MMKYLAFLVFGLLLLFEGCCYSDDGGYSSQNWQPYYRLLKLTDTTDRIIKISYKNTNKVFYPNDTVTNLIISENTENTLYIETKNAIDTIVLRVKVNYYFRNETCSSNELTKITSYTPKIVDHTFQNATFYSKIIYDHREGGYLNEYDVLNITP